MPRFMKISLLGLILTVALPGLVEAERPLSLVINELMASNSSFNTDPQGQYDDWIEIYNYGTKAVNAGGLYLTDNLSVPSKWRIPYGNSAVTTIPAGGFLLIWADGDITDSGLHVNFKLDAGGEQIALFDSDGSTLIDSVVFGEQTADISFGRYPDAGDKCQLFGFPSPSSENIAPSLQGFLQSNSGFRIWFGRIEKWAQQ